MNLPVMLFKLLRLQAALTRFGFYLLLTYPSGELSADFPVIRVFFSLNCMYLCARILNSSGDSNYTVVLGHRGYGLCPCLKTSFALLCIGLGLEHHS